MPRTIPSRALIVVADGGKAILLRNIGTGDKLSLREERRLSLRDLVNDGPSGSRPEEQTPSQTNEATFAKQLAEALYRMSQAGDYKDLVLVADPQTLGQLRDAMHKTVHASLAFTLDKDLTNNSLADMARSLTNG